LGQFASGGNSHDVTLEGYELGLLSDGATAKQKRHERHP
jgi:hypothetical protein